jgi:microcystin-dependent protein
MKNLKDTGLVLKTIKPGLSYEELLTELNYNFEQLLHHPGFKGIPGDTIVGPPGQSTRGSKWVFVDFVKFHTVYPFVNSSDQLNLTFINSEFANSPDKFYSAIYIPNDTQLIVGDIIVLPSGNILELVNLNGEILFVDTGIVFSQISQITKEEVITLILQYLGNQTDDGSNIMKSFNVVAKNANDSQPALNTTMTQGSAIDLVMQGSGPGYPLTNYSVVAPNEGSVTDATKLMLLSGSVSAYHLLLQNTQTTLTNQYAPQVNTMPAMTVLQNNDVNGIIFGNQSAGTFRNFGRLYRSSTATILTSSFSPLQAEYSELILANNIFTVRSPSTTINSDVLTSYAGTLNLRHIRSNTEDLLQLGVSISSGSTTAETYRTKKVLITASEELLFNVTGLYDASILSTTASGKVSATYKIMTALNNSTFEVPTSSLIKQLVESIYLRLEKLENADGPDLSLVFGQRRFVNTGDIDLNSLLLFGTTTVNPGINIINGPTIVNSQFPEMSIGSGYTYENTLINVFRTVRPGTNVYDFVQEVFFPYKKNYSTAIPTDKRYIKFHRVGSGPLTGVIWGSWNKMLDSYDTIFAGNDGVEVSGSMNQQSLQVKHKSKNPTLNNITVTGTKVVQKLGFDNYGHVTSATTVDLSDHFIPITAIDIKNLMLRLKRLEYFVKPFEAEGTMMFWNKSADLIPLGWQEVANWRSRMPIGWNPHEVEFNEVGKFAGEKEVVLSELNFPPHDHFIFSSRSVGRRNITDVGYTNNAPAPDQAWDGTPTYRIAPGNGPAVAGKTSKAGNSSGYATPHNNMPPYRVVMFIEPIPGYTGWQ